MSIIFDNQTVIYEEPVQERIRKLLKVETLFNRIKLLKDSESYHENFSAVIALTELYEIFIRSDIKAELIRELETQNLFFKKIKKLPNTNTSKLQSILERQEILLKQIYAIEAKYLDYLSNDELFKTIIKYTKSQNDSSPLLFWLSRDSYFRTNQVKLWLEPLNFIHKSVDFLLKVIRQSGEPKGQVAEKGFYLSKLNLNRNFFLIRVTLTLDHYYFPTISVGKQRLTIRFMTKDDKNKFIPYKEDINFTLSCCSID